MAELRVTCFGRRMTSMRSTSTSKLSYTLSSSHSDTPTLAVWRDITKLAAD